MTKKTRVLITCLADPGKNPRPGRMIDLCQSLGFTVDTATFPISKEINGQSFSFKTPSSALPQRISRKIVKILSLLAPFECVSNCLNDSLWGLGGLYKEISGRDYDAIIVHDVLLLPFCFKIKKSAKIIFDAREYYPGEMENNTLWKIIDRPEKLRNCKKYMPLCDAVMTVSQGIVDRYKKEIGVDCTLVRSAPLFYKATVTPTPDAKIRMVHHGVANRDRVLENMIDLFSFLDDRFTLDFYLAGDNQRYKKELENRASGNDRIKFLQPVRFNEIIPMLQKYDIGLYLLEPTGFNTEYSLPNKFFEFIQARLALAIGPSPDMADLVKKFGCGIISGDFSVPAMAQKLNALTKDNIQTMKSASDLAASELCFEVESKKIIEIFKEVGL